MASAFALTGVAIVVTVLLLRLCPVFQSARTMMSVMVRTMRVLKVRRASDHWKERAMTALSVQLFGASARFAGWLIVAVIPLGLAGFAAPNLGIDLRPVLLAWEPRLALVLVAILTNMAVHACKRRAL